MENIQTVDQPQKLPNSALYIIEIKKLIIALSVNVQPFLAAITKVFMSIHFELSTPGGNFEVFEA